MSRPWIAVGLGNPGPSYRGTRHNIGFEVIDLLARRQRAQFRASGETAELGASRTRITLSGQDLILAKPQRYMNRSGLATAALCHHYDVGLESLIVVYDDADLPVGRIRVRPGGSAGGHRGIASIIDEMGGGSFARIRLGVRGPDRAEQELAEYVLQPFEDDERPIVDGLVDLAADAVETVTRDGVGLTMNRFNGLRAAGTGGQEER